jgi:hypothetical protein
MSMKPFASTLKCTTGSLYIIILSMFIISIITFSGLYTVTATEEEDDNNTIQLDVTEQQEGVYRWSNDSGAINPTFKFIVNTDNIVRIQNPTDAEHEMIVESQPGNELTTSGDIEPESSGELSLSPNMTGTLQYYCEYHPNTMRGTVEVIDS